MQWIVNSIHDINHSNSLLILQVSMQIFRQTWCAKLDCYLFLYYIIALCGGISETKVQKISHVPLVPLSCQCKNITCSIVMFVLWTYFQVHLGSSTYLCCCVYLEWGGFVIERPQFHLCVRGFLPRMWGIIWFMFSNCLAFLPL